MPPRVVLDTCTLFPFGLRDLLLRCAERALFEPLWSEETLQELSRNLVRDAGFTQAQIDRLFTNMQYAFPSALVVGYGALVSRMTNHPNDRHVLAAAVHADASMIVTSNLRDFPATSLAPYDITIRSPDDFLDTLAHANALVEIVHQQASDLRQPPLSVTDLLSILEPSVPRFVTLMRHRLAADSR